jgi:hypothetical protein
MATNLSPSISGINLSLEVTRRKIDQILRSGEEQFDIKSPRLIGRGFGGADLEK